jgi:2-amino-4-hydroxy-6-hydroxymethyldihydropteridine diphosphokinase
MPRVFVSIGSNIDKARNIQGAVRALKSRFGALTCSRVYQSRAEGFDGEDFYNLVAAFDTMEPVEAVLQALSGIETSHGRKRGGPRFASRTLDLDILLYGNLVRHDKDLDIPRDEITQHAFVLGPLAEIAPALTHPETGTGIGELWQTFAGPKDLRPVDLNLDE